MEDLNELAASAYLAQLKVLRKAHPIIGNAIISELFDQRKKLKLIASENYSSLLVQSAMGNLLTDKYSEGFPFHRFYAGCENVDTVEKYATDLACKLFNAHASYVQPHSGADANLVAFWAILTRKIQSKKLEELSAKNLDALTSTQFEELRKELSSQTLLGLSLHSGGHLTHGYRYNVSAKMFRAVTYDVDPKSHLLDYAQIAQIARKEKPLILLAGYSAYPRKINFATMREIADEVGATLMVDMAHFAGLVAGGAFTGEENPIPYAQMVTSTTHKTLRGPRGGLILCQKEFEEDVNRGCPHVLGGPLPHIIAAKAVAFHEALQPSYRSYVHKVISNAKALAEGFMKRGIPVVTSGTDNHLVLLDLRTKGFSGRRAEKALAEAGVTVNRNMVPFDPKGAWYTSGIRLGTAALTTRGLGELEMDQIAEIIVTILNNLKPVTMEKNDEPGVPRATIEPKWIEEGKRRVAELLEGFPLYPELMIEE